MKTPIIFGILASVVLALGGVWLLSAEPHGSPQNVLSHAPPLVHTSQATGSDAVPHATTVPTIGTPSTSPTLIAVNTPTVVTVTVLITDPTLISDSANLLRLGATGTLPTILGVMHDSGAGVYTLQVTVNESVPGTIQLQVSAAFKGLLKRVLSPVFTIQVWNSYSLPSAPVSFDFPYLSNTPKPTVSSISGGSVALDIPTKGGVQLPVFIMTLAAGDGTSSLPLWFAQNIDTSNVLSSSGVYTLTTLQDGREVLLLTGGVPVEWDGGPLSQAYVMSSDRTSVLIIQLSQDDPLSDYGVTSQQAADIVNAMTQTVTFR